MVQGTEGGRRIVSRFQNRVAAMVPDGVGGILAASPPSLEAVLMEEKGSLKLQELL